MATNRDPAPGKTVADEFCIHLSAIGQIENADVLRKIERAVLKLPEFLEEPPNVAKLNTRSSRVSLLSYPDFFESPIPTLHAAWTFPPEADSLGSFRTYRDSLNPPILHRKELLVTSSHPENETWAKVTSTAESIGLFDDPATIGFRLNWTHLIESKGYRLVGNDFLPLGNDIANGHCYRPNP